MTSQVSQADFNEAILKLNGFIGKAQADTVKELARGEEGEFYRRKMVELAGIIGQTPAIYEQDDKGDDAVVYLHYFGGSCDFYITEVGQPNESSDGIISFGLADLGYGAELGYIQIDELVSNNLELDFHFEPKTLREAKIDHNNKYDTSVFERMMS